MCALSYTLLFAPACSPKLRIIRFWIFVVPSSSSSSFVELEDEETDEELPKSLLWHPPFHFSSFLRNLGNYRELRSLLVTCQKKEDQAPSPPSNCRKKKSHFSFQNGG